MGMTRRAGRFGWGNFQSFSLAGAKDWNKDAWTQYKLGPRRRHVGSASLPLTLIIVAKVPDLIPFH